MDVKKIVFPFAEKHACVSEDFEFNASKAIFNTTKISTYEDHRMAMAFACLAIKTDLEIQDSGVVSKSYPEFWDHLASIGVN